MRKYEDQNPRGWSREEPRRAAVVVGRTKRGRRKGRDGGSVGKQKLLKQRVYHELSKSLWAPDVGAILGCGLAQNLQASLGLPSSIRKGGFTGGRCRWGGSQRGSVLLWAFVANDGL